MAKKDMQSWLEKVKTAYKESDEPSDQVIKMMKKIAEDKYTPAMDFFVSCLCDSRYGWKWWGLDILGSNYDLDQNREAIEKVRHLLLNESNYSMRIKAAAILSTQSKWPDPALKESLISETHEEVLVQVFEAILILGGVPYPTVRREVSRVIEGEIEPTFEEIERITQELADKLRTQRLAQQHTPNKQM